MPSTLPRTVFQLSAKQWRWAFQAWYQWLLDIQAASTPAVDRSRPITPGRFSHEPVSV